MNVNLLVILLIVFMTMSSSVILLKFWMDFKISVWDRKNNRIAYEAKSFSRNKKVIPISEIRDKLYNKSKPEDIIIDCEVEVVNNYGSAEEAKTVYVQVERLLK